MSDTEPTPSTPSLRHRAPTLLFLLSLPFALGALLAVTAPWWWFGDVCLHFSWMAALALIPALLSSWRSPWRTAGLLLCLVAGWWPWWQAMNAKRASAPDGLPLEVASVNLFDLNAQRDAAISAVAALQVDLLGVQEVLPADRPALMARWPFAVWTQERHLLASALLSRHPIVWSQVHDLEGFALVDALVQAPTGMLRVYVAHLSSPKTSAQSAIRGKQLDQLAILLRDSAQPVLLLGDLNLSSASPSWRRFAADAGVLHAAGSPTATWPAWLGPLGTDIDHVTGRALGIGVLTAITIPGSDHRGVAAAITFR